VTQAGCPSYLDVFLKGGVTMKDIYQSLFSSNDLLGEQFVRYMFELCSPDGAALIYVNENYEYQANNPNRAAFLYDEPERVSSICRQIDDGDDPCVCVVEGGCVVGTQLSTEKRHCGYFLMFLSDYTGQTVQANMDIIELVLAQAQLVCQLIEKNNALHHLQLEHLSRTSKVLS